MSSSDSEEVLTGRINKSKKGEKHKSGKTKHGKKGSQDPSLAFQPPSGSTLLDHSADHGEFDWDAIKQNEDLELWVIRVPDNVKTKVLEDFVIDNFPSKSSHTTKIATQSRKNRAYDLYHLGKNDEEEESIGGEELRRLTCLLPRKGKKGKLFKAPKPISRQLVMQIAPPVPELLLHHTIPRQNAPRQAYPPELLTHQFMPYGSLAPESEEGGDGMAVDEDGDEEAPAQHETPVERSRKKSQKRKGGDSDVASPPKTKKAKKSAA